MLELVKNIEFVKKNKLKVNKISEKEFILENKKEKYILNLFPFGKFSKISKIFDCLNKLSEKFSNISYEDIGILNDKFCYRIIPFIIDEKNNLTDEESYNIGFKIGKFIFEYHKSFQGCDCGRWNKHYNYRINKFLHKYGLGQYRGNLDYVLLDFLERNKYCLKDRTCTTIIGLNGLEDIKITKDGKFQIVEEYKILRSDSYFEFRNLNLYYNNTNLLTGIVDGYFNNNVPRMFFKLLGVYTIIENLYDIFVESNDFEDEIINEKITKINDIYDGFSSIYPIWYLRHKKF